QQLLEVLAKALGFWIPSLQLHIEESVRPIAGRVRSYVDPCAQLRHTRLAVDLASRRLDRVVEFVAFEPLRDDDLRLLLRYPRRVITFRGPDQMRRVVPVVID